MTLDFQQKAKGKKDHAKKDSENHANLKLEDRGLEAVGPVTRNSKKRHLDEDLATQRPSKLSKKDSGKKTGRQGQKELGKKPNMVSVNKS